MLYVDIVKNDLRRGEQARIALLELDGEELRIHATEERLHDLITEPVSHPDTGDEIHPQKQPREFLEILHLIYGGSYVFATEPYGDPSESRFAQDEIVGLAQVG